MRTMHLRGDGPATLNGLFQSHLEPTGANLDWISDPLLLPGAAV
ncbi:MAG: hypothetical protein ACRDZQ_10275 [Acidimicrobiales bacterium]